MKLLLPAITILVSSAIAQAAEPAKPKYLGAVPKTFCLSGERVAGTIQSCDDNSTFVKAAQKCFDDFKALRKSTATDLSSRYKKGADAQNQDFSNHASDNKDTILAHTYMIALGEHALEELDDYFDWIEHPEDAMNDDEIMAEPCFRDNAEALNNLMDDFEDEVAAMKKARDIEVSHNAISTTNKQNVDGSVNQMITGGQNQAPAAPAIKTGTPKNRDSDVTGIEESKKKNEQKK